MNPPPRPPSAARHVVPAPNGKKRFADKTLEAKPKWWKFCFRAGPDATKAARDFAAAWLAELNAPQSAAKLSDDK